MTFLNFLTNNLIILNYPTHAGGKFIANCLAISPTFLHQHKDLAKNKINENWNETKSYNISKSIFKNQKNTNQHFELGCVELSGFFYRNSINEQKQKVYESFKWLTNQNKYLFCLTNHYNNNAWAHFKNAIHIFFRNYKTILKKRNAGSFIQQHDMSTFPKNYLEFDMNTVFNKNEFKTEIKKINENLNIKINNFDLIENLRCEFLNTFKIGYIK